MVTRRQQNRPVRQPKFYPSLDKSRVTNCFIVKVVSFGQISNSEQCLSGPSSELQKCDWTCWTRACPWSTLSRSTWTCSTAVRRRSTRSWPLWRREGSGRRSSGTSRTITTWSTPAGSGGGPQGDRRSRRSRRGRTRPSCGRCSTGRPAPRLQVRGSLSGLLSDVWPPPHQTAGSSSNSFTTELSSPSRQGWERLLTILRWGRAELLTYSPCWRSPTMSRRIEKLLRTSRKLSTR